MENANLAPGHLFNLSEVKVINEVKVTPRSRSNCKCLNFYQQVGGGPSTERHACLLYYLSIYQVNIHILLLQFTSQRQQKQECLSVEG